MNPSFARFPLSLLALLSFVTTAPAETYRVTTSSDWFSKLNGDFLKPGDTLILAPGVYTDRRLLEMRHRGTPEKPIVIQAEKGAIFKRPDARQNSLNLAGCQHLTLRGLEITGGDAGIRIRKSGEHMPEHLLFENLHIHHIGGPAFTANNADTTYRALHFVRNHIHHTGGHGEGFYLGCNNAKDGSTPGYVFECVIRNNYIHHLNGKNVSQGDGIELKDGSYGNLVCDNVIHDTRYPGITVYGTDGNERNTIERNVIWNTGDHGIQAAADSIIRNNIIHSTGGEGIHCRTHQSAVPGNLTLVHNTILSDRPIRVFDLPRYSGEIVVANNALSRAPRIPRSTSITQAGNVLGITEIYPSDSSLVIGTASAKYLVSDDFNGKPRSGSSDAGAYRFMQTGNPGWKISPGFKLPLQRPQ